VSQFVRPHLKRKVKSLKEDLEATESLVEKDRKWRAYVNDVHELEARIGDIVGEAKGALHGSIGKKLRRGDYTSSESVIEDFTDNSFTWQSVGVFLTDKNQKKMLQAVYHAMAPALEQHVGKERQRHRRRRGVR